MKLDIKKGLKNRISAIWIVFSLGLLGCNQSESNAVSYPVYNTSNTETSDLYIQSSIIANKFDDSYQITVHAKATRKPNSKVKVGCEVIVSSYQLHGQESGLIFDGNSESTNRKLYAQPETTEAGWFITLSGDVKILEDYEIKSDIKFSNQCPKLAQFPKSLGVFELNYKTPNWFERFFYST